VAAPSLAGLKARLDGAGSTLGWWKGSLPVAGGWNRMVCEVPANPNHSVIHDLRTGWDGEEQSCRCHSAGEDLWEVMLWLAAGLMCCWGDLCAPGISS